MEQNIKLFCENIPLYINGSLAANEKNIFEQNLKKNSSLKHEYMEFYEIDSLFDVLEEVNELQFEQLFKEIQNTIKPQTRAKKITPDKLMESRIAVFLKNIYAMPQLGWGMAMILFTLLIVSSLFSALTKPTPAYIQTNTKQTTSIDYKSVNVVFADNATQKQIRNLLVRLNAKITNGPTATGMYTLFVPGSKNKTRSVIMTLKKSKFILLAEPAFI